MSSIHIRRKYLNNEYFITIEGLHYNLDWICENLNNELHCKAHFDDSQTIHLSGNYPTEVRDILFSSGFVNPRAGVLTIHY